MIIRFKYIYDYRTIDVMFENMDHDQTMEYLFRKVSIKKGIEKYGEEIWRTEKVNGRILLKLDDEFLKMKLNIIEKPYRTIILNYIKQAMKKSLAIQFDNPEKIVKIEGVNNIGEKASKGVINECFIHEQMSVKEAEAELSNMIKEPTTETEDLVNHMIYYKMNDKDLKGKGLDLID